MADVVPGEVTPETPVAAPEATTVHDTTADQVETQPEAPPERTFTQKEVDDIAAKRAAQAERRALKVARAEAEAAFYKQQLEAQQRAPQQQQRDGRPREEDFQGRPYHEFAAAVARFEAEQVFEQRLKAREQESMAQKQQRDAAESAHRVKERLSEGADEFPDFEEVALADHVPITPAMAQAIVASDMPAKVAYYLGSHLDEAKRIADLPPEKQFREIVKLESKVSETPTPTRTPPPIQPSQGRATVDKDPSKMTDKEFAAWRKRQIAQR